MKILLCMPYILAQFMLFMIIVGLKLRTNISEFDSYAVGFFIVNYGFLIISGELIRRKYWPKK